MVSSTAKATSVLALILSAVAATHVLLVKLKGPESAMRGFASAIAKGDLDRALAWSLPEEQSKNEPESYKLALRSLMGEYPALLQWNITKLPGERDHPLAWYIWNLSWSKPRGAKPLPTRSVDGIFYSGMYAVPTHQGWRVSMTRFLISMVAANQVNPDFQAGRIKGPNLNLKKLREVPLRRAGISYIHPVPVNDHAKLTP